MLAKISADGGPTLVLGDDFKWTGDDADFAQLANKWQQVIRRDVSVADGEPHFIFAEEIAKLLNLQVVFLSYRNDS